MNIEGVELPDPLEIIVKGREDHVVGYACQKCGCVFMVHKRSDPVLYEAGRLHEQKEAAQHCEKTCPCGQPIEDSYRLRCRACRDQLEKDKEKAHYEKSKKLTIEEYDGPVYWEGHIGDMGDGYFSDIDALLDYCEEEGVDVPDYVWACKKNELKLDAEGILENAVSDMYEDAYDSISEDARAQLQAYLNTWCNEQNICSWFDTQEFSIVLRERTESTPPAPAEPADLAG